MNLHKKIIQIIVGWYNLIFNKQAALAARRKNICDNCPKKKHNNITYICSECGCPLMAKQRSTNDKCPLEKW